MANSDFRMTDVTLPLCELGPAGRTRAEVQAYYDRQRFMGLSVRDPSHGTEFALNVYNISVDPSGKTVTNFNDVPINENIDSPEAFARAINSTTDSWNNGFMTQSTWQKHVVSLWGTINAKGLINAVKPLVTSDRARALALKVQTGLRESDDD